MTDTHRPIDILDSRDRLLTRLNRHMEDTMSLLKQVCAECDAVGDENFEDVMRTASEEIWKASKPIREHVTWLRSVGR